MLNTEECPSCGNPYPLTISDCPYCGSKKCEMCNMGDDVECPSCDIGDEMQ